mmetsp:Transcript_28521/g.52022  ORF Transcript_28521/g.52022 Transcript_28521/m.52022 type:complete len:222 (-) Transcript_28521:528-1193(-)
MMAFLACNSTLPVSSSGMESLARFHRSREEERPVLARVGRVVSPPVSFFNDLSMERRPLTSPPLLFSNATHFACNSSTSSLTLSNSFIVAPFKASLNLNFALKFSTSIFFFSNSSSNIRTLFVISLASLVTPSNAASFFSKLCFNSIVDSDSLSVSIFRSIISSMFSCSIFCICTFCSNSASYRSFNWQYSSARLESRSSCKAISSWNSSILTLYSSIVAF